MRKITIFATALITAGAAALPASATVMYHHRTHHNVALNSAARATDGQRPLAGTERPVKRDAVPAETLGYMPGRALVPGDASDF
ncbi:hypothetical protein [Jiella mangrovi]|uniref:Uncharacterized protein n=1 Tax=Jiella mangrovi TaxID=2821407 RepID=A0ABS4BH43_9HYPH|nr:hypothetical protein [Jiella mangrovi]MBP0616073.1 hypothetical protein [Jiella mangrovi]